MKTNVFLAASLAAGLFFASSALAQVDYRAAILEQIQAIQNQIAALEQLLAQMPQQTGSVNDFGIADSSSIGQIYPAQADVTSCVANNDRVYPATGFDSASWFLWNKCAQTKTYQVTAGSTIVLNVYGDNSLTSACRFPNFTLYDNIGGNWQLAARIDLSNMSGDLTRNYFYTPISSQVRVTANNCFYLKVYSGNLSALKNTFNLREDLAFGASIVPAVANPPVYAATDHWIRILSPSGGERWQPGSTRQIMWMSNKVDKVLVGLKNDTWINPSSTANYISPNFQAIPAAMGYYAWTINTSFLPSGANNRYKITVDEYNPDGTVGVGDESGYITIAP